MIKKRLYLFILFIVIFIIGCDDINKFLLKLQPLQSEFIDTINELKRNYDDDEDTVIREKIINDFLTYTKNTVTKDWVAIVNGTNQSFLVDGVYGISINATDGNNEFILKFVSPEAILLVKKLNDGDQISFSSLSLYQNEDNINNVNNVFNKSLFTFYPKEIKYNEQVKKQNHEEYVKNTLTERKNKIAEKKAVNDKKLAEEKAVNDKKLAEEKAVNDKKLAEEKAVNDKKSADLYMHPACEGKDNNVCDTLGMLINMKNKGCYRIMNVSEIGNNVYRVSCELASYNTSLVTYTVEMNDNSYNVY